MKVYIVTSGEYSSYEIEAVFTDYHKAEIYCAIHPTMNSEIEEYEVNQLETNVDKVYYGVEYMDNCFYSEVKVKRYTSPVEEKVEKTHNGVKIIIPTAKFVNYDTARKIIQDFLVKHGIKGSRIW